jgi:Tol biopolymer transport system component
MEPDGSDPRRLVSESSGGQQWSPDGSRFAHTRDGRVFVHDADGANPVQITAGEDGIYDQVSWCPDEVCLALHGFSSSFPLGSELFALDLITSVETQLAVWGESPSWSPDGTQVAYVANSLYVVDANGSNDQEILPAVVNETGFDDPDWGPSGIVFVRVDIVASRRAIWRVDPDGSNLQHLTFPVPEGQFVDQSPHWSPDGTQIAFLRRTVFGDDESLRVFVMDADGSNLHEVPGQSGAAHSLDW